ncbi:hypothetical protein ACEUZ9_002196 [Paracoccus litorisediminis]
MRRLLKTAADAVYILCIVATGIGLFVSVALVAIETMALPVGGM